MIKGRFAPSPTGRMHLGNIASALLSWLSARAQGGAWLLRIEDLDPQRSKREYSRIIEDDLHWLGLDWDEGGLDGRGDAGPYSQSRRGDIYARYLELINATGYTYPCRCTRAEIMATQAPHQSDGRIVYGGRCRPAVLPAFGADFDGASTRICVPDSIISFDDGLYGPQHFNLAREVGDFILRRADGAWAYQLAVVVDDALMGVSEVVRGSDLLLSAAQQIYLYRLLGLEPPRFAHVPLLCNAEGRRLSKRDGSLSMEHLRATMTAPQIIGRLAALLGLLPEPAEITAAELIPDFSWQKIKPDLTLSIK
ncbi:MAG: tRNA glutamyl-Q(34) synthetase GluQRS [Muribaculaceae bacterium]|nr:tRNA glutamyl-Q(34) synthetase GluQRS [Muribaculaceae bacterium]